jgi:hypothetical protein
MGGAEYAGEPAGLVEEYVEESAFQGEALLDYSNKGMDRQSLPLDMILPSDPSGNRVPLSPFSCSAHPFKEYEYPNCPKYRLAPTSGIGG